MSQDNDNNKGQSTGGVIEPSGLMIYGDTGSEALYVNGKPVHVRIVQHDTTRDYLSDARGKVVNAIADMRLATMDAPTFAATVALDALHDALTAIEAEMEATSDAQP